MHLTRLVVSNFKSLHRVDFTPGDLSVVVGANAAGKTNLSDSIDFLSEVYRHGLEVAVARRGGFENMAFRRMRRTKGAIGFDVTVVLDARDIRMRPRSMAVPSLRFRHSFAFATKSSAIDADFAVISESIVISAMTGSEWEVMADVTRSAGGDISAKISDTIATQAQETTAVSKRHFWVDLADLNLLERRQKQVSSSELLVTSVGRYTLAISSFVDAASRMRVFQISPTKSREFGVPLPRPVLEGSGANLPAVVDLLKKKHKSDWRLILSAMRAVIPQLTDIRVAYTTARTLGLLFEENGVGRPWTVGEVSDGTVQALALLVAIFDQQFSLLVLEEPENSVHPWIIRRLMQACDEASKTRQIIITTHSPIVIDSAPPDSVYVVWRSGGETHLALLKDRDEHFLQAWSEGQVPTFDYLDSGAVPEALPPSPSPLDNSGDERAE